MAKRRIEYLPLDEIQPHPSNPRTHESLADVADSVDELGYIEPIVRDERTGKLVAGHGRLQVLEAQRDTGQDPPDGIVVGKDGRWQVPVVVGWSSADDAAATRARITLNRTAEVGGWDDGMLLAQLDELANTPIGLKAVGFTEEAHASLRRLIESSGGALDVMAEWAAAGMPDFTSNNMESAYHTTIHFPTMEDAEAFFKMIDRDRKSYIWWPSTDGHRGMNAHRQYVMVKGEPADGDG